MVTSLFDYELFKAKIIEANKDYLISSIYDADGSVDQMISLQIDGYRFVSIYASSSSPTTFTVEFSYDNNHWFMKYTSQSPETVYNSEFETGAIYIRLKSTGTGNQGDKVTLIITAKR